MMKNKLVTLASQTKSDQEWKKQIIHLAGGAEGFENANIKQLSEKELSRLLRTLLTAAM